MSGVAIRRATAADLAALEPMMAAFNASEQIAWDPVRARPAVDRLLASDELGVILLAETGGAPIAYAVVTWGFDLEFAGRDAFLTELFVEPSYRRRHVGARLLEASLSAARAGGAAALHLMVDPANPTAIGLYRRADFEPSQRVMMTKRLR
jgi:ribosomal protein S18 acetylase RimI-like enzyme